MAGTIEVALVVSCAFTLCTSLVWTVTTSSVSTACEPVASLQRAQVEAVGKTSRY